VGRYEEDGSFSSDSEEPHRGRYARTEDAEVTVVQITKTWLVLVVTSVNGLSIIGAALISGILHAGC
jgi:hypothetical protein